MRFIEYDPMGIHETHADGITTYMFDTHRRSYLCWLRALKEEIIQPGNLLITLDAHYDNQTLTDDDAAVAGGQSIKEATKAVEKRNTQDWMFMGMEAGIITDAIIISPGLNSNETHDSQPLPFVDSSGKNHAVTFFPCIEDFEQNWNGTIPERVILDIDMDYFLIADWMKPSKNDRDNWPEILKAREYVRSIKEHITKRDRVQNFLKYFVRGSKLGDALLNSKITTIAYETKFSSWCAAKERAFWVGTDLQCELNMKAWALRHGADEDDLDDGIEDEL